MPKTIGDIKSGSIEYAKTNMKPNSSKSSEFSKLLQDEISKGDLKISKHADQRLKSRNINLSKNDWKDINIAIDNAKTKGIKNSIVIKDEVSLIVNIPSKTVISAMAKGIKEQQIYTNIDGAIVL